MPSWVCHRTPLDDYIGEKIEIDESGARLTCLQFLELLSKKIEFQKFINNIFVETKFPVIRWESRPVSTSNADEPYKCVILQTRLSIKGNSSSFKEYFKPGQQVASFPNIGKNATMIVPAPLDWKSNYPHLAEFARTGPVEQICEFWKTVGQITLLNLGSKPLWLNTAGAGVPWLHVRLDTRPKYYNYLPYKNYPTA